MPTVSPTLVTPRQQRIIAVYFSILFMGVGMHSPAGFFFLPIQFYFKNKLHLSSQKV